MFNNMNVMTQYISNNQFLFSLVLLWTLAWKGLALWKSARDSQKWWFIALLIVNTMGILEILYIYIFSKTKMMGNNKSEGNSPK